MSILVATDFSAGSEPALRAASQHAQTTDSKLTVLHCLDALAEGMALKDFVAHSEQVIANAERQALDDLQAAYFDAVPQGLRPEQVDFRVVPRFAPEGILEVLHEEGFGLVVLGPTGAGTFSSMLFGSTAEEVVRAATVPVLVVPPEARTQAIESIVAPVDLSAASQASLAEAIRLARAHGAHLDIVHHYAVPYGASIMPEGQPSPAGLAEIEEKKRAELDAFLEGVDLDGIDFETTLWRSSVVNSSPAETIVERARDDRADLVVMGTHGRRGFKRLFLGSTAFKVLRHAPCQVMVVRGSSEE